MRSWLLALGVFVLVFPSAPEAQALLEGLDSVGVSIDHLGDDATSAGLSEASLKTAVELRLRQSGIRVEEDSTATLSVSVPVLEAETGGYAYGAQVALMEDVYLPRRMESVQNPDGTPRSLALYFRQQHVYPAMVWQRSGLGTASPSTARTYIRDDILEKVDEFANAYLAANPR